MDFKNMPLKTILLGFLAAVFLISFVAMKFSCGQELPADEPTPAVVPLMTGQPLSVTDNEEDAAIQAQLDHDRQQQSQTKDLKIRLEQIDLELEQEKALAEINKLKKENMDPFDGSALDGQKSLPEIKVEYIGGSSVKKEAILSIAGASYQVKEKSSPTDNIQVVSISDSSVTLHFNAPQDLTKTIDYKPE